MSENRFEKLAERVRPAFVGTCVIVTLFVVLFVALELTVLVARVGPTRAVQKVIGRPGSIQYQSYELWTAQPGSVTMYGDIPAHAGPDGFRLTPTSSPDSAPRVVIFGGSTVWGSNVPDAETLPGWLAKSFGEEARILNRGERGFNSTQELNRFMRLLSEGDVPDVAVFYDGVNDIFDGVYSPARPRVGHHYQAEFQSGVFESNILLAPLKKTQLFFLGQWSQRKTHRWNDEVKRLIDTNIPQTFVGWRENIRMAKAIADAYGVRAVFALQPALVFGDKPRTPKEVTILDNLPEAQRHGYTKAYTYFANALSKQTEIHDLSNVFAQTESTVFSDFCHLTSEGNRIVAERLKPLIRTALAATHARGPRGGPL